MVCLVTQSFLVEVLSFWLATASRVFTSLNKPMLFLCRYKDFHVNIYSDDIWVLTQSILAKDMNSFVLSIGSYWITYYIFQFWTLPHLILFFEDCVGIHWICQHFSHLTNFLRCSNLLLLCYRGNLLKESIRLWSFWTRPPFVPVDVHNPARCDMSFRVIYWLFTILLPFIWMHCVWFLLLGNNRKHMLVCPEITSMLVRMMLDMAKTRVEGHFPGCCSSCRTPNQEPVKTSNINKDITSFTFRVYNCRHQHFPTDQKKPFCRKGKSLSSK